MQTGQNSIVPENTLPQLWQVRWVSVLMFSTVIQLQFQRTPIALTGDRCESSRRRFWHPVVQLHE
jgi:hypothetical protein